MVDGRYELLWYAEPVGAEEAAFEPGVFLLTKARSETLRTPAAPQPQPQPDTDTTSTTTPDPDAGTGDGTDPEPHPAATPVRLRVSGTVPPESWNRLGTRVIPKLRSGEGLTVDVEFRVEIMASMAASVAADLRQALAELDLEERVSVECRPREP